MPTAFESAIIKDQGLFVLLPDAGAFGMNGAALAALGEMAVDFMLAAVPLVASNDGVKLGDSTFNRFFRLVEVEGGDQLNIRVLGLRT